jgi:4-amino-4-deoxy-L-arabinose transferase-like glycosyltransferase
MVATPQRNRLLTLLPAAAVFGLAAALFFSRLGERALWSEEVRWAEIPREMQRTGDYFRPMFNGRPYPDKPVGSYWLVLAAAYFTGGVNELAARLPSAISALAAVVFLMLLARRLYDVRVAILAGAILATSYGFVFFARTASADAETVAGVLAALWLFLRNEGRAGWWVFAFWLVMALTSLTKGLLGFALPLLVAGVYSTWAGLSESESGESRIRRVVATNGWLLNRMTLLAAPLAAAVYLAPFLLPSGEGHEGLAMVFRENIRRFYDPVNHRGPVYLYAYVIFELLAPWSVLLPAALIRSSRTDRFALAYFWSTFLFFTLSASRRSYYLLPVLPAAAILIAVVLTKPGWFRLVGVWLFAAAVLLAPVVLVPPSWRPVLLDQLPELPAPGMFLGLWAVAAAALVFAAIRPHRIPIALIVAAFALEGYLFVIFLPAIEVHRTQRPFAIAVRELLGPELSRLALYQTSDIVYYLDPPGPLPELHDPADLHQAAADGAVRWVILRRRDSVALGTDWTIVISESGSPWDQEEQTSAKLILVRPATPQ